MAVESTPTEEIPFLNRELVASLIHQKLDDIRSGDLYVQSGIGPNDVTTLLTHEENYKKFEGIIGKTWMDIAMVQNGESGLNGGKLNRKKKMYVRALRRDVTFVQSQIDHYVQHTLGYNENDVEDGESSLDGEEETISSLSDNKSRSSSKAKKKHKKKKRKKDKKKKRKKKRKHDDDDEEEDGTLENDDASMESRQLTPREEKRLERRLKLAKEIFEETRKEVIARIPQDVKDDFRQIGFSKWGKEYLPILQVGPYDVGPGGVRDQWMIMFENTLRSKRPLTRLVFWYGTSKEDLSTGFSFVPSSKIISYEQGCKQNCHKLPAKIEKKLAKGTKLTQNEKLHVSGLEEINADAKLPTADRATWLFDFEEDYEEFLEAVDDETSDEEDEEMEELKRETSIGSDKKKKKKKKDKSKKSSVSEDGSKKKKKKRKRDSESSQELEAEVKPKKKQPKKEMTLDEAIEEEVAQEDAMMELESESEDDEDDADFKDGDESSEEEELYEDATETKKKEKKTKGTGPKKKAKKLKSPEEIEQELFDECEDFFLPIMESLKGANDEKKVEKLLKKIDRDVHKLTPAFFRIHQIGLVVKETRTKFKSNNTLNLLCKQVTQRMKKVFHEKSAAEPEGFKPKMRGSKKKKKSQKQKDTEVKKEKKPRATEKVKKVTPRTNENEESLELSASKIEIKSESNHTEIIKSEPIVKSESSTTLTSAKDSITEVKSELPKLTPKPVKAKPPRKSFSLAGMMERKPTPTPSSTNSLTNSDGEVLRPPIKKKPVWTTNYQRIGNSFEESEERQFGMKFLMDAVSCLPKGSIDPPSVARALEDALHTKYDDNHAEYMAKLHDVCSAIAGKKQMGSLAQKIIAGDYATPYDVISLPRKTLFQSFEGFWIP